MSCSDGPIKIPIALCRRYSSFKPRFGLIRPLRLGTTTWHSPTQVSDATRKRIAEYEQELRRSPDNAQVLYQLGHCELETGDLEQAITRLKKATELDPSNADSAYDLGKALLLAGDTEGAIAALQRSIALKPADPSPHYQLARALEKTGKSEQAKLEWQRFAELKKAQPEAGGMATGRSQ